MTHEAAAPHRLRTPVRILLFGYWLALLVSTHWPRVHLESIEKNADKYAHIVGYAGLSFLLSAWLAVHRRYSLRNVAVVLAVIVAYSIFDELTQTLFGRTCDPFDALADWFGAILGQVAFWPIAGVLRRIDLRSISERGA